MGLFSTIGSVAGTYFGGPVGGAIGGAIGGALEGGGEASSGARMAADQQREAAAAAKFRPIGVTTGFGTSKFVRDAQGNLTEASYALTPEMQAQQRQLMGVSGGLLNQYQQSQQGLQPIGQAGQGLIGLGQGYLATTPQEQAQKFMAEQQALLAPARQSALSSLQNQQFQQGRTGLAIGGGNGMMATNPEMAAYYNAIAQQDAQLAAQSTQGGMDYAKFGAGLVGTGGGLMGSMYDLQSQALSPYKTALGGAQTIEGLGQNAMDLGINIGAQGQAGQSTAASLLSNAARTEMPANQYSPWSGLLSGMSSSLGGMGSAQGMSNWWNTKASAPVSNEVSSLGSSTWNPWSDYNTGAGAWGSYGE